MCDEWQKCKHFFDVFEASKDNYLKTFYVLTHHVKF